MDADLQDNPKEIYPLIDELNEGYDVVSGWKKVRKDPFEKKVSIKIFNFLLKSLVVLQYMILIVE